MNHHKVSRRAALLGGLAALPGCSFIDDLFTPNKDKLPGTRVAIMDVQRGLEVDSGPPIRIALPRPATNPDWPQTGGNPAHVMQHLQVGDTLTEVWRGDIGTGGGYRRKITAQPVASNNRIYTMDSDALVKGYDIQTGARIFTTDTASDEDRSGNVGGGLALSGDTLFASTGRGELLAIDAATGSIRWRAPLGSAARSAPTVVDGRAHIGVLDNQLVTLSVTDGKKLWSYQANTGGTGVLGLPAPAVADGIVVAGFTSGDLVAFRAASGAVAWADSLASARGRNSLVDLSAVHGLPAIADGRSYAGSFGGLLIASDLRSGRRLWERDITLSETPWVAGDFLFVVSVDGEVAALTRAEGRVVWLTKVQRFENEEKQTDPIRWIGPVLAGDRLILAGNNKVAISISPYTGEILGQQDLSGAISVSPVVVAGTVFLVTDDGTLTALR